LLRGLLPWLGTVGENSAGCGMAWCLAASDIGLLCDVVGLFCAAGLFCAFGALDAAWPLFCGLRF
jgi:hypothetical protein